MDLRGYGGSDKTPRGYDPASLSADITGVIRSLGERQAVLIGHGWGGYGAWTAAAMRPAHVRAVAVLSMPHPLVLRQHLQRGHLRHSGSLLGAQLPLLPERRLVADDAARIGSLLRRWSAPGSEFPDDEATRRYRAAMRLWPAPHCALEYQRWVVRSLFRVDGRRFAQRVRDPIAMPVLQIHGADDRNVSIHMAAASRPYLSGEHRWALLDGVGHFPHEEAPGEVNHVVTEWLADMESGSGAPPGRH
jgi:pimeloyl-ACP methyl ester carboxylesterase